jgi:RHS repeat-associated protein
VDHTYSYGAGLLHDSSGNTVYTPGFSQRKSGTDAFFHTDWIGSTRYLTAANGLGIPTGYRFDAFGNQSAGAGIDQTSLKFAGAWGYQSDVAMHLQLLGARYYDPEVGRFLSPDPIGFLAGLNLYAYCGNNPVGRADPFGLSPFDLGSDEDITNFGRLTGRLVAAQFHRGDMAYANAVHEEVGYGRFGFGDVAVGNGLLAIHSIAGTAGAGGPAVAARAVTGAGQAACAVGGRPGLWTRMKNWFGGLFSNRRSTGGGGSPNAIRPVGALLQSVEDVIANPQLLKGLHPVQVEALIGKTPGWRIEGLGQGAHRGQGWMLREYTPRGHPTGRTIGWHPGGGHHGPHPYWKVNSGHGPVRIGPQF